MAELFTNLARSTLAAGITNVATSLTVQTGDGNDLFPNPGGSDFFRCILFKKATGDIEIIRCTARSGDTLTITRAQEQIGNLAATAFAFNAGDIIELRPTKGFFDSLGAVTTSSIQQMGYNFGPDVGSVNAYSVTLSPVPAAYASPLPVAWLANATNTGNSTLIGTGLGTPKDLRRLDGSQLRPGDVVVNTVAFAMFDTTAGNFKLLNPRSAGWPSDFTFDADLSIGGVASFDAVHNYGSVTATSQTIDWNNGNKQEITLAPSTGNNITLSFTAPPGPTELKLAVKQDATGNRTITLPGTVKTIGGATLTLSTAASSTDILTIYYDGSFYYTALSKGWA